jgi:ABC-2 type transport system ATP-binding protein
MNSPIVTARPQVEPNHRTRGSGRRVARHAAPGAHRHGRRPSAWIPRTFDGTALRLRGVVKSYGSVRAVDGIDLTVPVGESLALLGLNGAGKSTTINMILGLIEPDAGDVTVLGRTPEAALRAGALGGMLQDTKLIPRVSIREVVEFVRGTYAEPMPMADLLRVAQLTELADRRLDKLSGGQAQRVRFALALAGNPQLLILDEPTAALDVESRRELWTSMREYADRGNTILFSTHHLDEADQNADRVVVVAKGNVIADGAPGDIKGLVVGRTVSFTLGDRSSAGLDRLPGVRMVEIQGHRAQLNTTDSDATVQSLVRQGLMHDLEVTSPGLEEAFIALAENPATAATSTTSTEGLV